jgi:Recombination endonuclease VII
LSPKGTRGCKTCRNKHSVDSHKRNPEGTKQYQRDWMRKQRAENPERLQDYHFRKDYGITIEERNAKLEKQNHCCAVCKRLMENPHVDHDHETDQIRDLLCRECNSGLGFFKDDVLILESALAYLRKWKEQ